MKSQENKILFAMFGYNQLINIDYALRMNSLCKHFIYIDSYSQDGSDEILKASNVEVIYNYFLDWPSQRNISYEIAKSRGFDWLMILDADEMILENKLVQLLNYQLKGSAYFCNFDFYFCGHRLRFSGHRPRIRLVNVNQTRFEGNKMQEYVHSQGSVHRLNISRLIYNNDNSGFDSILIKQINRAKSIPVKIYNMENKEGYWLVRLFKYFFKKPTYLNAILIFFYNYFIRLAFLDGKKGFQFCFANAFIFHLIVASDGKE